MDKVDKERSDRTSANIITTGIIVVVGYYLIVAIIDYSLWVWPIVIVAWIYNNIVANFFTILLVVAVLLLFKIAHAVER